MGQLCMDCYHNIIILSGQFSIDEQPALDKEESSDHEKEGNGDLGNIYSGSQPCESSDSWVKDDSTKLSQTFSEEQSEASENNTPALNPWLDDLDGKLQ